MFAKLFKSILLSLMCLPAMAKVTYVDHFLGQTAGEIGLLSLGLGRDVGRHYSFGMLYGYLPTNMSGGSRIETVAIRQTYAFGNWRRVDFYTGLNIYHVLGVHYENSRYGDAPKDYYSMGSIRAILNLGLALGLDNRNKKIFYFESGMNNIWIENYLSNRSVINPTDHVTLAMGIKYHF